MNRRTFIAQAGVALAGASFGFCRARVGPSRSRT